MIHVELRVESGGYRGESGYRVRLKYIMSGGYRVRLKYIIGLSYLYKLIDGQFDNREVNCLQSNNDFRIGTVFFIFNDSHKCLTNVVNIAIFTKPRRTSRKLSPDCGVGFSNLNWKLFNFTTP